MSNYCRQIGDKIDQFSRQFPNYTFGEIIFSILTKNVPDKKNFKLEDLLKMSDQDVYIAARKAYHNELDEGEQEVNERTEPVEVLNEALDCLRNQDVRHWNYMYKKLLQMQEETNIKGLRYSLTEKTIAR